MSGPWLGKHLSKEHRRKISESVSGEKHPMYGKHHTAESLQKMSGENGPNWKGGVARYTTHHQRAGKDYPSPLGQCQIPGCDEDAIDRARIDHTNLPYSPELVMPMCHSHNTHHSHNNFLILFEAKEVET